MFENIKNFFKAAWSWLRGEGFDFEWTGLLDGFESAIKEMPNIAKRQMTETEKILKKHLSELIGERELTKIEKALAEHIAEMSAQFNKSLLGEKPDLESILKGTGLTDEQKKNVTGKGKGRGVAAREARLLTMTPGTTIDPAKQTADNTRNQLRLQQHMLTELKKQNRFWDRRNFKDDLRAANFA